MIHWKHHIAMAINWICSYWSFLNLDWIPTSSGVTKLSLPHLVQTLILISPVPETVRHNLTMIQIPSNIPCSFNQWACEKNFLNWKIYECYIHYIPVQDPFFKGIRHGCRSKWHDNFSNFLIPCFNRYQLRINYQLYYPSPPCTNYYNFISITEVHNRGSKLTF